MAEGQGAKVPEFLSTHPSSDKRIEEFINHKITMGCSGNQDFKARYQEMIKTLP
jgi:predicted Zn-dependent protease